MGEAGKAAGSSGASGLEAPVSEQRSGQRSPASSRRDSLARPPCGALRGRGRARRPDRPRPRSRPARGASGSPPARPRGRRPGSRDARSAPARRPRRAPRGCFLEPGVPRPILVLEPGAGRSARDGRATRTASSSRRASAASAATSRAYASSWPVAPPPSSIPSRGIRNGSVRPWPTRVARITANVRKITRLRSGKSIGRASAAASDTTPRIPAQRDQGDGAERRCRVRSPDLRAEPPRQVGRRERPRRSGRRSPRPRPRRRARAARAGL